MGQPPKPHSAGPAIPEGMLPTPWRVDHVGRETADSFTFALVPASQAPPLRFASGQFNMLYVFGVGEVPISISGNPLEPAPLIHTIRAVGAVTRAMRKLNPGDALGVRGPFGTGWPMAQARGRDVVLVAGGIGLAPLRPALLEILSRRAHYGRVILLYGGREPKELLYRAELRQWARNRQVDVHITVDRATAPWRGNVGVVTTLIPGAMFDPPNTIAFLCGPEVMMRFAALELHKRGVPLRNMHVSMERNMKCAIGLCGHCQFGPEFICKDGPVFPYDRVKRLLNIREI